MRGVPIRLELGPRDLADGSALMSTRLGQGKSPVSLETAPARLASELAAFQDLLLQRATDFRDSHTATVDTWEEFTEAVKTGWALAFHCGQARCEDDIKAATSATARCIPADGPAEQGTLRPLRAAVRVRQAGHLRPGLLGPISPASPCACAAPRVTRRPACVVPRTSVRG